MVCKIKFIVLFLISFILCILCYTNKGHIETNLLKTVLPQKIIESNHTVSLINKTSSSIRVVFEGNNEENLDKISNSFKEQIDKDYFEISDFKGTKLIEKYTEQCPNFISINTKALLKAKKYDEINNRAMEALYNPLGIQISSFEKDPYFLLEDFLLSNKKMSEKTSEINDKYYDYTQLKIKNQKGLSDDLTNKKIKELIDIQKKLSDKNSEIYLGGSPIHSYYSSLKSIIFINIICILSSLMIIFLTYFYFRNLKLLILIALSISFGMLCGYCATRLWFYNFQIITMVFSATLIGVGIDYSYHYFFAKNIDKTFYKNLTFSFLTSVIPFILLYLTKIELLKQISVFTIFGLFGIYLAVLYIYPNFKLKKAQYSIKINDNLYKIILSILLIMALGGFLRFHFNDTISALYSPNKKLKTIEALYNKVSGESAETQIITVSGKNDEDIIKNEEEVANRLIKNNIEFISISKFLPSKEIQKENFELVYDLYKNDLAIFADILSTKQISHLKNIKFKPVEFKTDDFPFLKDFMLDKNTSMMFVFSDKTINISNNNVKVVNFKKDIQNCIKEYRNKLMIFFPITVLILMVILSILYDFKKAVKILTPSITGIIFALLINSLIMGELNLFSIITIYLIIGFTIDYSIFRTKKEEKTEDAILISCITTSFSFLLLSFCGFKLLSTISLMLFFGIITSYLTGYFLFLKQKN